MALSQQMVEDIASIARESARAESQAGLQQQQQVYQQERQQFEQRYQQDMAGAAQEIRDLNERLLAYQRGAADGAPAAEGDGLPEADVRPRPKGTTQSWCTTSRTLRQHWNTGASQLCWE